MNYILHSNILGQNSKIDISEQKYNELKKSKGVLFNALEIEEKYEIILSSYLDFEQKILSITAKCMVHGHLGYSDFFEIRLSLNVKLINLLTAVKLYVDQVNQNVTKCLECDINAKNGVDKFFLHEFENNKYYRFMSGLRNYVQHNGLPVHLINQDSRWKNEFLEHSTELFTQLSVLKKDKRMKGKYINGIEDEIDLKIATRSYIESISNVHHSIRDMITDTTNSSRESIEKARLMYLEKYNEGLIVGLHASKKDGDKQIESISLLLDWDDVRVKLQARNKKLVNLGKRFTTGMAKEL